FSQAEIRNTFSVVSHAVPKSDPYVHLITHFGTKNLKGFGVEEQPLAHAAASLLLTFLEETQQSHITHLRALHFAASGEYMPLDPETIKNLELFYDSEGNKEGSLLAAIDETNTAMGGRMLRNTLLNPLQDEEKITERLDVVEELTKHPELLAEVREELREIADLERLLAKVACKRANPRDLVALKNSLQRLPQLSQILKKFKSERIGKISESLEY